VVARSAFESSMRYRSAVLFGQCHAITEQDAKRRALEIVTDALIPGRS
jgi:nitroimidazol reductase NimA-like FMN-containing flavoprotein (pyridoxamine 5'-phosphate oxidase superfamily)